MGPCMCGDTHCPSCGPAQGNWRCPICRCWADDGCEHLNDDGSDVKDEFKAAADEAAKQEAEAESLLADSLLADLEDYWKEQS